MTNPHLDHGGPSDGPHHTQEAFASPAGGLAASRTVPGSGLRSLPMFLLVSIGVLVVLTIGVIVMLFLGSGVGNGTRGVWTFIAFAVFAGLTALDTARKNVSNWYLPAALIVNSYILAMTVIVAWVTPVPRFEPVLALGFITFWTLLVTTVLMRLLLLACEVLQGGHQVRPMLLHSAAIIATVLVIMTGFLFTLPLAFAAFTLTLGPLYWKFTVSVLILAALALSVFVLLVWQLRDEIQRANPGRIGLFFSRVPREGRAGGRAAAPSPAYAGGSAAHAPATQPGVPPLGQTPGGAQPQRAMPDHGARGPHFAPEARHDMQAPGQAPQQPQPSGAAAPEQDSRPPQQPAAAAAQDARPAQASEPAPSQDSRPAHPSAPAPAPERSRDAAAPTAAQPAELTPDPETGLLPWPTFADGTPLPPTPDGQPDFSVPGAPEPPHLRH